MLTKDKIPAGCELIFDNKKITHALDVLAERLNHQLQDEEPVILCVMQGGLVFSGHIIPRLHCMLEINIMMH